MLALIYGGAASGKSEYAEALALTLSASILPLFYVATLSPSDPECIEKIKLNTRHYAKRQITYFKKMDVCEYIDVDGRDTDEIARYIYQRCKLLGV